MDRLENDKEIFFYPSYKVGRRVIIGSIVRILCEGIGTLKHIFLIPLFLWAWGKIVYGEWVAIYSLVVYLSLIELGMHNSVRNRLTQSSSKGNLKEFTRVFQSASKLFLSLIIIALISFSIFVFLAPINKWLNINITHPLVVKYTVIILGVYVLFSLFLGLFKGLYVSLGEYVRANTLDNLKEITLILLLGTALIMKANFVVISSFHLVPLFLMVFYYIWDIHSRHNEKVQLGFSSADWRLSFSFMGTGLFFFLILLGYTLNVQGSILVISNILGAVSVAVFSIHRTLAHSLIKIISTVCYPLWPELTAAEARGDYEKLQLIFNILIKFSLLLSFSIAIFLFFTGEDIIKIWTGNKIRFEPFLWLLLLIYIPLHIFWSTCGLFQMAVNRPKKLALAWLGSNILGLTLAIIFTRRWGIIGTLTGFAIPELVICIGIIPHETLKIIGSDKRKFWLLTIGKGLIVTLFQILIACIIYRFIAGGILQVIVLFLGVFISGALAGHLFWLNREQRKTLKTVFAYGKY